MKREMLNGISLRLPFVGAVSTLVTEGDWRGDGDNPRPFICRYREPGDAAVQYNVGWLSIFRDPPGVGSDHTFIVGSLGCVAALRAIIVAMIS